MTPHAKHAPRSGILPALFFDKPAQVLAKDLLGVRIARRVDGRVQYFAIAETEAYLGPEDLACHSSRGRTRRTEVMFGAPGTLYIYLVYGLHQMLNVVAGPQGAGAAVLIRSAGAFNGPGRLGKALGLSADLNGKQAARSTGLWFEAAQKPAPKIVATPRIGVDYAGPDWAVRKLRFVVLDQ